MSGRLVLQSEVFLRKVMPCGLQVVSENHGNIEGEKFRMKRLRLLGETLKSIFIPGIFQKFRQELVNLLLKIDLLIRPLNPHQTSEMP